LFSNICLHQFQSCWSHSSKTLKQTVLYDVETQEMNIIWITAVVETWKLTEYRPNSVSESSIELEVISVSIYAWQRIWKD
jgi:hypothetical protein